MQPKILGAFKELNIVIQSFRVLLLCKKKSASSLTGDVMSKALDDRVCVLWTWERSLNISARQSGTGLLMHLCTMVTSFRISLFLIGSQFSDRSPSKIWAYFNLVPTDFSLALSEKKSLEKKFCYFVKKILLICFSLRRQFETVLVICSL